MTLDKETLYRLLSLLAQKMKDKNINDADIEAELGEPLPSLIQQIPKYVTYDAVHGWILNADGLNALDKLKQEMRYLELEKEYEERELTQEELDLAAKIYNQAEYLVYFLQLTDRLIKGDEAIRLLYLMSAYSVYLSERQLHVWSVGESGKGKTYIPKVITQTLPRKQYEVFTSATPKPLYYYAQEFGEESLRYKIIFFDEVESSKDTIPLLRSLTDHSGVAPRHLSMESGNKKKVLDLRIPRPQVVWFTSVQGLRDDQLKNRFLFCNPNESLEQDRKVFEHQDYRLRRGLKLIESIPEFDILKHIYSRVAEEGQKYGVIIPYRIAWHYYRDRRLYPLFISLIHVITRVNYRFRMKIGNVLVSHPNDFILAKLMWDEIETLTATKISKGALAIYEILPESYENRMTTREIADKMRLPIANVKRKLEELYVSELINKDREGNVNVWWKDDKWSKEELQFELSPDEEIKEMLEILGLDTDKVNEIKEYLVSVREDCSSKAVNYLAVREA